MIVETHDLIKYYGEFRALNNLNVEIDNEIYGLAGPNGAGKTTFIKILLGILKPSSGDFTIFNKKLDKKILENIGYMPQNTALYMDLTVHENIEFFGKIYKLPSDRIEKNEKKLLNFIQLEDWRDELIINLSGGMQRKLSLACSMVHDPKLLFLDEPTVGIDPELRDAFWKYFEVIKKEGKTILITTHYMDEAFHCDRVGLLRNGEKIAEDHPKKLIEKYRVENLEDVFLKIVRE